MECEPQRLAPVDTQVGIDVGLKTFATLSPSEEIENPRFFRNEEKARAQVQRKPSQLAKGTPERRTHCKAVARVHERIAFRRENFTHQNSRQIVDQYGVICVEDLAVNHPVHHHCLSKSISERVYQCPCCHLLIDRDHNASLNIRALGLQSLGLVPRSPCLQTGE